MGMYTEILVKARLSDEAQKDELVMSVVKHLFNNGDEPSSIPNHNFFTLPRWDQIGRMCSFYHHPRPVSSFYDEYSSAYIFSRSDIKNYDGEIEAFFDWLKQHIDAEEGQCIGYSWYEEEISPTLIFKD